MNSPESAVACWYVDESEYLEAIKQRRPYCSYYKASNYFLRTGRVDNLTIEGFLGRYDEAEEFHNAITSIYSYFAAYQERKNVYFTFDRSVLFKVLEIYPQKPLLLTLKQITNLNTKHSMINQEEIYQLIYREEWKKIIELLYKHKKDITSEPLLLHAASTFEQVLLQKINTYSSDDKEIKDVLGLLYILHHGNFYQLSNLNIKLLTLELAKRSTLEEAFNYASLFPDEEISKEIIARYNITKSARNEANEKLRSWIINWVELFNRLFELINEQGNTATYFSGPRFIQAVKEILPYFPDYNQYIQIRNNEGKSTSRKIFYYDILLSQSEDVRIKITDNILKVVRPFQPQKVAAIDMLLGRKPVDSKLVETTATPVTTYSDETPVVFISYSWDDEIHKEWVLKLANRLAADGIEVILDRFYLRPGKNLIHFIEKAIERAHRIIIVFTPNYKLKADKRSGGVGYEYSIMNAELYESQTTNEKVIPVLRVGDKNLSIPAFMQQFIHLDLRNDETFETSYYDLIREIFNEPAIKKPVLGSKPDFHTRNME